MVRRMRQQEEAVLRARMEEVKGGFGAADKAPWIPAWDMWPDEHGIRCCARCACCACCACCAYALVCVRRICTVCACVCAVVFVRGWGRDCEGVFVLGSLFL